MPKTKTLQQHIIAIIAQALKRTGNNKTLAARQLGCSVRYIRYLVKRNAELARFYRERKRRRK